MIVLAIEPVDEKGCFIGKVDGQTIVRGLGAPSDVQAKWHKTAPQSLGAPLTRNIPT
jgi:hypothetical protein